MRSLDELKAAVEDPRIKIDARFFRSVTGEMLNRLHFFLEGDEFISWIVPGGFITTNSLKSARRSAREYKPIDHVFCQRYAGNDGQIVSVTHYDSWNHFEKGEMRTYVISGTSMLRTEKKPQKLEEIYPKDIREDMEALFNQAFEKGFLIEGRNFMDEGKLYFFTPKIIYKLVAQKTAKKDS